MGLSTYFKFVFLNSGCHFNKEFCQLLAQYLFCNFLQLQVMSRSPLVFVDLCQIHFLLNYTF